MPSNSWVKTSASRTRGHGYGAPLNAVRGDIDIEFAVQGSQNTGKLKLKATRESKLHPFDIHHWILQINDAQKNPNQPP